MTKLSGWVDVTDLETIRLRNHTTFRQHNTGILRQNANMCCIFIAANFFQLSTVLYTLYNIAENFSSFSLTTVLILRKTNFVDLLSSQFFDYFSSPRSIHHQAVLAHADFPGRYPLDGGLQ